MLDNKYIKESAFTLGFDLVGITFPRDFEWNREMIEHWVESGAADNIDYMKRHMDVRFNPAHLLEGAKSVVVCALNYKNQYSSIATPERSPQIASYALCPDYHKVVRKYLKRLLKRLQEREPTLKGRCCVDTAPLLEKQLAYEAGLGWIGRQSLLITPQFGSFVVLGVLLLDHEVNSYDSPYQGIGCGECRQCIEHCPTGAILENRMIDSRRCISALTVECDNESCVETHGWIFGCDECQRHCPHNRHSPLASNSDIEPIFAPISADEWRSMSPEEFAACLSATPMKRGGLERLKRNCERVVGK